VNIPICKLKVVQSSSDPAELSIRGPKGRGHGDAAQAHITSSGLRSGDDVVLLRVSDYNIIAKHWNDGFNGEGKDAVAYPEVK
jgi:hypothetical protein